MIYHQPYVQCCKHVNYNQIAIIYATFITHLFSVEILTLNKCKHWDFISVFWHVMLDWNMYVMLKCDIKSPSETNIESMHKCNIVPFCKFQTFITSFQSEILCWFHFNSTNFGCWGMTVGWMLVTTCTNLTGNNSYFHFSCHSFRSPFIT